MALLIADGMEFYGDGFDVQRWTNSLGRNNHAFPTGSYGVGQALTVQDTSGDVQYRLDPPGDRLFIGFDFMSIGDGADAAEQTLMQIWGGTSSILHVNLVYTNTGKLLVKQNTTVLATATQDIYMNTWYTIEFDVTINGTTGQFVLKIDGQEVANETSQDTSGGGDDLGYSVIFDGSSTSTADNRYDNIYICDDSGAAPFNALLDGIELERLTPDGDGNRNQFTRVGGGTNNYEAVDDSPGPDDDTTYNHSSTAGNDELYTLSNITRPNTDVLAVMVVNHITQEDAGYRVVHNRIRSNTDEAAGASVVCSEKWMGLPQIFVVDPQGGGAWTEARVNALEVGFTLET
jgi:hypothetical protein